MNTLVRKVFGILAICTLSLLLWGMIFVWGRPIIWSGIEPALEQNWKMYTFEDGRLVDEALSTEFNGVKDLSTN